LKPEVLPKSLLGTAVTYGLNKWEKLTRFHEDGRIDLSNNKAGQNIKPFVIGRNYVLNIFMRASSPNVILNFIITM